MPFFFFFDPNASNSRFVSSPPKKLGFSFISAKMDGENKGKPYEQMDDLGGPTPIFENHADRNCLLCTDLASFFFDEYFMQQFAVLVL